MEVRFLPLGPLPYLSILRRAVKVLWRKPLGSFQRIISGQPQAVPRSNPCRSHTHNFLSTSNHTPVVVLGMTGQEYIESLCLCPPACLTDAPYSAAMPHAANLRLSIPGMQGASHHEIALHTFGEGYGVQVGGIPGRGAAAGWRPGHPVRGAA